ncbi:4-oxalocrotonate tautomerase [Pseudomonas indica]|uniref:4-oxalocrotonate tautomerase n=1 Tax=Pseudomonas indica TaxID=137658 RepID=UPI000BAB6FC6|nr:4-oxalocrotonate tautomerase [Pseudomonas indica]PAU54003.1 4-oxalocrotonate tautomerase [Pseudomonas indica]
MPLTLTLTEGVLPKGSESVALSRLSEAMLRWHGLSGNPVMTPNVIGAIHVLPEGSTYAGSQPVSVAIVEWKVPSFAFASRDIQQGYIAEATDIIREMSGGRQPRERIWVNVTHAVDGAWGIAGEALTNVQLGEAIAGAAV